MLKIDFTDISWPTDKRYRVAAYAQLCSDFPFVSALSLKRLFETYQCHYFPTKNAVELAIATDDIGASLSNIGLELATSVYQTTTFCQSPLLQKELLFVNTRSTTSNNIIECQCCYGEYEFEDLIQCSDGCLFCRECLNRYTEETVFGGGRFVLKCMSTSATPCNGVFTDNILRQSLPEKVYLKLGETEARAAVLAAELKLVQCHACAMQVEMEDADGVMVCPCGLKTCCKCGKTSHSPYACNTEEKIEIHHTVEEAMTRARLRNCGKCKASFIKVDGCNNIKCACGAHICYVCNQMLSPNDSYSHFRGECPLMSDSLSGDKRAMLVAGRAANTDNTVNVNKLLENQSKKNNRQPNDNDRVRAPAQMAEMGIWVRKL